MKILFIYTDVSSSVGYSAGIGVLSSVLKREGHDTRLIHVSKELDYPLDLHRIIQDVRAYNPGLICFSITTNQWFYASQIGQEIRKHFRTPIIVGGHHPTSDPENVIAEAWVDFVCRGEGEKALTDVARRLESNLPIEYIPNLTYKKNDSVIREPMGTWIEDLDTLPFDDHDIFSYAKIIDTRAGWAEVIVTRGCPYSCSYCFNKPLLNEYKKDYKLDSRKIFAEKDFATRRRSVEKTIEILNLLKERYPNIKGFTFVDDVMAKEGEWFSDFARRYPKEIGLPYACTSQPLLFTETLAKQLKDSGCKVVKMGVEAGNEDIRKKVLKRNISNAHLKKVFCIARDYGLKPQSFNMIGIPFETVDNMMETIRLNAHIKPYIVWLSTFNPYPGTELYRECLKKGMINADSWNIVDTYRGASVLKEEFLHALDLKKIRVLFRWFLNATLGNGAEEFYQKEIDKLYSLPDKNWQDDTIEKIFLEKDQEIDEGMRAKDISHYVGKKYLNIYWGREYDYDLT